MQVILDQPSTNTLAHIHSKKVETLFANIKLEPT
jgi:hypothetical protein